MTAEAWLLGLHLLSAHAEPGWRTVTPGIYAIHQSGATIGALRNSEGGRSLYAGWTWQGQRLGLTVGGITGYHRQRVLPLVVPSLVIGQSARLSLVPNPFGASAVHLSVERRF